MGLKRFTRIAMIAAIYTGLCFVPGLSLIAFGPVQVRIAEALTVLPVIYQPAVYGVTLGCFLANLTGAMTGLNPTGYIDAAVGTLATFLAAVCTYRLRNKRIRNVPLLSMLMPVVFNFFIVGAELGFLYMPEHKVLGMFINGTWVAIGEFISVIAGYFLARALKKTNIFRE